MGRKTPGANYAFYSVDRKRKIDAQQFKSKTPPPKKSQWRDQMSFTLRRKNKEQKYIKE